MSDERQHAEAVAREWMNGTRDFEDAASLADLLMAERAGLLARAEAAEASLKLRDYDRVVIARARENAKSACAKVRELEAMNAQLRYTACQIIDHLNSGNVEAARVAACDLTMVGVAAPVTVGGWSADELAAKLGRAEAAAGQMRAALDTLYNAINAGHEWSSDLEQTWRRALATDIDRDYQSPEQIAQACAAARAAALAVPLNALRNIVGVSNSPLWEDDRDDAADAIVELAEKALADMKASTP